MQGSGFETKRERWLRLTVVPAIALALASCAIGPDYTTPEHAVGEKYLEAKEGEFNHEAVLAAWWRSFNDAKLESLIEQAIVDNKTIDGALARVNESRALRQASFYNLLPTIRSSASFSRSRDSTAFLGTIPGVDLTHEVYRAGLDATWELDLFGRVRRSYEQAGAQEESSIASLQDVLQTVMAEVAQNYMQLRGLQAQLVVNKKNAASQEETLRVTETQFTSGQISELDAARARAQYKATLSILPTIEAAIRVTIHRLSVLTGKNPDALAADLEQPAALPKYEGAVALGDPASLLKRRPDVRSAERNLAAYTAGIGVAEADIFPRVTFNGSLAYEAPQLSNFGKSGTETYGFGPNITWAAFDMGRVIAQIHAADARAQGALAQYEATVLGALEDVENALVRFSSERVRRAELSEAAAQSAKAADIAAFRYKQGATDFLTVLDANRAQLVIEDQLSQSETQLAVNLIGLYKALGGGWEEVAITTDATALEKQP